jgi:hypothetical protein
MMRGDVLPAMPPITPRRAAVAPLVVAVLLAACVAEPPIPPSPSAPPSNAPPTARTALLPLPVSPTPTDPAPPTPVSLAGIPPDPPTTATVEGNGVRLTIELERNPMLAGEPTWIDKTITNTGRDAVIYYPCGESMSVGGPVVALPWRPGRRLPDPAKAWKEYLISVQGVRTSDRYVLFLPQGQDGSASGCGDIGYTKSLVAGATIHERARWDGFTFRQLAPPPTARLDVVGTFKFDRGDPLAEHPPEDRLLLEVHLDTWIAGLPDALLDPAEAADVALTDPRLTSVLASRDLHNGNEGVVRFDPVAGVYQIGMLESGDLAVARVHLVLVDARTGEIVGFVERDWDYTVDGYP